MLNQGKTAKKFEARFYILSGIEIVAYSKVSFCCLPAEKWEEAEKNAKNHPRYIPGMDISVVDVILLNKRRA